MGLGLGLAVGLLADAGEMRWGAAPEAPLKPAEFVIIYLQQMAGQVQV